MKQSTGYKITVKLYANDLEEYAKAFLAIFNNVRESKDLIEVTNSSYSHKVWITCKENVKNQAVSWLEQFGEIDEIDKVLLVGLEEVDVDYDFDEYEDLMYYIED